MKSTTLPANITRLIESMNLTVLKKIKEKTKTNNVHVAVKSIEENEFLSGPR